VEGGFQAVVDMGIDGTAALTNAVVREWWCIKAAANC